MHVVSVINYKGGVGKTTLTANLGAELAARGHRVLLIDLDPQTSLTFSFVRPDEWLSDLANAKTIKEWFTSFGKNQPLQLSGLAFQPARASTAIRSYKASGELHLVASHLGLINVDLELATELGGASLRQSKLNYLRVHGRLAQGLAEAAIAEFDVVLIDCPPNFNVVTKTAIVASDYVLIPAKADYLSTLGIDYLQRNIAELVHDYNEYAQLDDTGESGGINPQLLGVVFTMVQYYGGKPIAALRPYISQTAQLGVPIFDGYMRENKTFFADAPQEGIPVVLSAAGGAQQIVTEMESLTTEFATRLGI